MTRRVESAWRGEDAAVSAWLQPDGNLLLAPDENDVSTSFFSSSATRSSFDARRSLNAQRMVSSIKKARLSERFVVSSVDVEKYLLVS